MRKILVFLLVFMIAAPFIFAGGQKDTEKDAPL